MKGIGLSAILGIQQMFGNFGSTDDKDRETVMQIQGSSNPGKQRTVKPRKSGAVRRERHRRTYTHGKVFSRSF